MPHFPRDSLLRKWLGSLQQEGDLKDAIPADFFMEDVAAKLRERGHAIEIGRSVAGIPIDLLVRGSGGGSVALDLVGQRGRAGEEVPMQQLMLLQRAGLKLLPLGVAEWQADPARCLAAIESGFPVK